jgi:ankyrin repeat protein
VPQSAARYRSVPPKRKPLTKRKRGDKNPEILSEAANAGDIGLVLQALKDGIDPTHFDEYGYMPLHWAASPDEGMPGDTISRRA